MFNVCDILVESDGPVSVLDEPLQELRAIVNKINPLTAKFGLLDFSSQGFLLVIVKVFNDYLIRIRTFQALPGRFFFIKILLHYLLQ